MEFKIISGYYDQYDGKVIPCRILAVKNGPECELTTGTMAGLERGTVENGIFCPTGGDWMISEIPDLLGCIRDPHAGEEILKLTAKNRGNQNLKKFEDNLGRLHFKTDGATKDVFVLSEFVRKYGGNEEKWEKIAEIS